MFQILLSSAFMGLEVFNEKLIPLAKGQQIMSKVARICLIILALGILIGLFSGGIVGGIIGLFLAGILAVPIYCLSEVLKRNAAQANTWEDPLSDLPSSSSNDASQLPKGAYEPPHHGGF